jgi:uncharacterized hydrophobic protein (TIGR00271 family)
VSFITDIRAHFRKLPQTEKLALQRQIVHGASPGLGFYLYVVLSGTIATLGLLTNSSPVIIGAMLLAPLMSPIIGIGLSTVIGDWQLLKASFFSLLRGALLAVTLAAIITSINTVLPFVSTRDLAAEIISRTRPTPIDLVIAIAGGLGGAYALSQRDISAALPGVAIATALMPPLGVIGIGIASLQWDVAIGAFLLFITNAAAIAFSAGVIFFLVGFNPKGNQYQLQKNTNRLPRSIVVSTIMIILLAVPLTTFALSSLRSSSVENAIYETLQSELDSREELTIVTSNIDQGGEGYHVELTIRTPNILDENDILSLQDIVSSSVGEKISMTVNQILVTTITSD